MPALMLNTKCKYEPACTRDDQSRVLHWYSLHSVCLCVCVCVSVCMCLCALIYSYTYTCVSCINEPQDITVRDEKNGWFSIDIGRRSTTTHIRKLEYLYFCLALLPYRFIFIPSIFILPGLIPVCTYILSAFSLRVTFSCQKRDFGCSFFSLLLLLFSSFFSSFNSIRTNRASLISKSFRFILTLIPFLSYLSCAHSFFSLSLSFTLSLSLFHFSLSLIFLSFLFCVFLSELRNPTKCSNC